MDDGNLSFEQEGQGCEVREVKIMQAMGLITTETDSVSALSLTMSQADIALCRHGVQQEQWHSGKEEA